MKPPGRRADVQADEARRVDLERVERGSELVPAAADVRLRVLRPRRACRRRAGRPACDRAGRRRPPPLRPCRPGRAPGRGCATRPGRARRAAGRAAGGLCGSSASGSPAYRGTAGCTGTHPGSAVQGDARRSAGREHLGAAGRLARASARVSRTCSARPGASRRSTRAQVRDRAVVDEPVARDPDDPDRRPRGRPGRPAGPPRRARGRRSRSHRSRRSPRT